MPKKSDSAAIRVYLSGIMLKLRTTLVDATANICNITQNFMHAYMSVIETNDLKREEFIQLEPLDCIAIGLG